MKNVEEEIEKIRTGLKGKVTKLNDLQNKEDIKGFDLKPLTNDELGGLQNYF